MSSIIYAGCGVSYTRIATEPSGASGARVELSQPGFRFWNELERRAGILIYDSEGNVSGVSWDVGVGYRFPIQITKYLNLYPTVGVGFGIASPDSYLLARGGVGLELNLRMFSLAIEGGGSEYTDLRIGGYEIGVVLRPKIYPYRFCLY